MVVFSMNSKRVRRPSVKLWEIGDLSAAFACSISQRNKENLGQNQWITDPHFVQESEYLLGSGQKQSEYSFPDHVVSPKILDNILQNRENKNPNSLKPVSQLTSLVNRSNLEFGTITRKSRLMRRRRRNPNGSCSLFGSPWNSDSCFDMCHANGLKDSSEHETSSMNKEACAVEIDGHEFSMEIPKPNEFSSKGASYGANTAVTKSASGINKMVTHDGIENRVGEWLDELGFGEFAQMFEMHEVDEDALPLITFEDLKEMGIVAIGPRRKLFTAIQQLKGGQ